MLTRKCLQDVETAWARFKDEHGPPQVDVVIAGEPVPGLVGAESSSNEWVLLHFADGHMRFVPYEVIAQIVIRDSQTQQPVGYSARDAPTVSK
jgi:hypothetical protein